MPFFQDAPGDKLFDLFYVEWTGEEESLAVFTLQFPQDVELLIGLDTFGNNVQPEVLGQRHDRTDDCNVLFILHHLINERAIDFESVDWEVLQIPQTRVPSSEVIDTQLDAQVAQAC